MDTEYGPAPEPETVTVGVLLSVPSAAATTVTDALHEPIAVLPSAVVPEASDTGAGAAGPVRSGALPPPEDPEAL